MEWKIGEHFFAYFLFLVLFVAVGVLFLLLLKIFEINEILEFWLLFFVMSIIFFPIAKFWRAKFLNKGKDNKKVR